MKPMKVLLAGIVFSFTIAGAFAQSTDRAQRKGGNGGMGGGDLWRIAEPENEAAFRVYVQEGLKNDLIKVLRMTALISREEALDVSLKPQPEFQEIEEMIWKDGTFIDVLNTKIEIKEQCFDDTGTPKDASTERCKPLSPICLSKKSFTEKPFSQRALVGLVMHEFARHSCREDTHSDRHPIGYFVSANFYSLAPGYNVRRTVFESEYEPDANWAVSVPFGRVGNWINLPEGREHDEIFLKFDSQKSNCPNPILLLSGKPTDDEISPKHTPDRQVKMDEFHPLYTAQWVRCSRDRDCSAWKFQSFGARVMTQWINKNLTLTSCSVGGAFYSRRSNGELSKLQDFTLNLGPGYHDKKKRQTLLMAEMPLKVSRPTLRPWN